MMLQVRECCSSRLQVTSIFFEQIAVPQTPHEVTTTKIRGFESASELYRSSDRRRSAKLVPTLADRGCHVVSATSPSDRNFLFSRPGAATISSK
jgi:hypothetical protein